jgi:transposase
MVFMSNTITLTKSERMELTKQAASRSGRAEAARRARLVLLLAEGHTWDDICDRLPCSRGFIDSWSKRFAAERVAGLYSRHRGQTASVLTPRLEARILEWTLKRKPPMDRPSGARASSVRRLVSRT